MRRRRKYKMTRQLLRYTHCLKKVDQTDELGQSWLNAAAAAAAAELTNCNIRRSSSSSSRSSSSRILVVYGSDELFSISHPAEALDSITVSHYYSSTVSQYHSITVSPVFLDPSLQT
jgi:hypothetical protein